MCTPKPPKASQDDAKAKELRVLLGRKQLDDLGLTGSMPGSGGSTGVGGKGGKVNPLDLLASSVNRNTINGGLGV